MAEYKKTDSGLLVPSWHKLMNKPIGSRGLNGRESVNNPNAFATALTDLTPDDNGIFRFQRLDPQRLGLMSVGQVIHALVRSDDSMSFAMQTYEDSCIQDYEVIGIPENESAAAKRRADDAVEIAKDFIAEIETGDKSYIALQKENIRYIKLEGGLAKELYFEQNGTRPVGWINISPLSLRFEPTIDDTHGEYYKIIQKPRQGDPIVLQDKADPNPTFFYEPVNQVPGKPYGASPFGPAIATIFQQVDLAAIVTQFLKGQASPQGVIQILRGPLADAGYDPEQIDDLVKDIRTNLKGVLEGGDATQIPITDSEIAYEIIGALGKARLDGLEMFAQMLERKLQRALRLPDPVFGTRSNTGLGSGEYRVQWQLFQLDLVATRSVSETVESQALTEVVRSQGNSSAVQVVYKTTDEEGMRIQAERRKMQAEMWQIRLNMGAFIPQEARQKMIQDDENLDDIEIELPEEAEPQGEPQGQPDTNDPEPGGGNNE